MNNKEVITIFCESCDSEYKLIYEEASVSGKPKFCPFCSDETFSRNQTLDEMEENGFHEIDDEND